MKMSISFFLFLLLQGSDLGTQINIQDYVKLTWQYKSPLPELLNKGIDSLDTLVNSILETD